MSKLKLALVGCGGMGNRHLKGLQVLVQSGMSNVEIVGIVDPVPEHIQITTKIVEDTFGRKPVTATNLEELQRKAPEVQGVDITTPPSLHHPLACEAFERGYHVMLEKPMGVTVKACQLIVNAAKRYGRVLSVSENYRRDPINRLARHLIEQGTIGRTYFMMQHALMGGNQILQTPWRHDRNQGGLLLDVAVHNTDIVMYYLGEFEEFYAAAEQIEPVRYRSPSAQTDVFLQRRHETTPEEIRPTGEDFTAALIRMKSGATVSWSWVYAGQSGLSHRHVFGTRGRIDASSCARNGNPVKLLLDGRERVGEEILEVAPKFELDELTSRLFGPRCTRYDARKVNPDAAILAVEYFDFARAALGQGEPEVGPEDGMAAVAAVYALLESAWARKAVRMEDVLSGKVAAYQESINAYHRIG